MSKVWFVTGSSRGLGRAIVEHALERGDQVVATARKPEQLDDLVTRHGDRVKPVALDVTDAAQAEQAVRDAVEAFGRLDIVVNNAGYGDVAAIEDVSLEDFRRQIDTNFYGVVYVTKAVLPILREQGSGHIFQVSSLSARIGGVGLAAYQSSKWAVSGFSTGLAQEVAPFGVRVTVLEPSGMATDWAGSSMTIPPVSEPYQPSVGTFAEMVRAISGNEPIDVAKVAQVVADLAGRDDAPLRLLLGADAVQWAGYAAKQLAKSDEEWRALSESIVA
jgi:NAD(P)-dependent dehydrogenase (short-subunit alcohol dehydrogenase family)